MKLTELKDLRKQQKIKIKELSSRTGINRDRLSLVERGKVNPSYGTVEAIVESLGGELVLKGNNIDTL
jgi:transcriptional regulator with XRE-family HTH domain